MAVYPPDLRRVIKPTEQEFNTFPLPAVTAIDTTIFFNDGRNPEAGFGSGIVISPNYVLSAAHNFYPPDEAKKGKGKNQDEIRVSNSRNQLRLNSREIGHPGDIGDLDVNVRAGRNGDIFYLTNWKNTLSTKDDIALVKTVNNALISPSPSVGLIAFVNPGTAKNYKIQTAGYPVDNVSSNIPGNSGQKTRDLVLAPGSFDLVGRIHKTLGREMLYSYDIDTFTGQSGSPVWHTLEGDLPRVLGVHSSGNPPRNSGTLIDLDIYNRIIQETKDDSGIIIGNDLPENAIIGTDPSFIPIDTPFSTSGNDEIIGTYRRERIIGNGGDDNLYGGGADDRLEGGEGDDRLEGGEGNDELDGGVEDDVAVFSDSFENYEYEISESTSGGYNTITFTHPEDGTDTLRNIEWAQFGGEQEDSETLIASSSLDGIPIATAPRTIPLPLEDGVEKTESIEVRNTTRNYYYSNPPTPPKVSITAPISMLDGDIDYTLDISYEPDSGSNIVYIIDTSASMDAGELQTVKDAYIDLTNYYIDSELAQNSNFGVVQFSTNATSYFNLTASEAISTIEGLTTSTINGTVYDEGLYQGLNFLSQSSLDIFNTNNIVYFVSGDISNKVSYFPNFFFGTTTRQNDYNSYLDEAEILKDYAKVNAFGFDRASLWQIDDVDSNDGVMIASAGDLSNEFLKSDLAKDVELVNILLDGEVVDTLTPNQLTDSPMGLTYEGSIDGLDVSMNAQNVISAQVLFAPESNLTNTTIDYTVSAGGFQAIDESGNPIAQNSDSNEDPFERTVNGGDSDDEITLGYVDRGASGGAGSDEIIGNRRDNTIDGGAGDDTISAYEGNDTIITGSGRDKVNGGSGIDTVVYEDVAWVDGSNVFLSQAGNSVSYNNTDTLTNTEFIQFSDVRISSDTLEITPVVEVAELSITEGNLDITTARLDFNLSTPAPVDVVFDYSTEDINATAGSDYSAASGSVTIPAGDSSASLNLEIIADTDDEGIETFALNYSALSGATFSNNQTEYSTVVTIENKDAILPLVLNGDDNNNFLEGDILKDSISGGNGNDTLKGLAGNDNLNGGFDNDVLNGGVDDDSLYGGEGSDTLFGDNGRDRLDGEDGNDYLYGGNDNDRAYGGNGTDVIYGEGGNDWLRGVHSHDTLYGGEGDDTLFGDNGTDRLDGEDGDDYLYGGNDNDRAYGGNGTDRLDGEDGDDYLYGGNDDDRAYGGNGKDTIYGEGGNDWLRGVHSLDTIYGGEGNDTIFGDNGNDRLDGQDGDDYLYGGNDNDRAYGGNGQDTIYGEGGNDWLRGVHSHDTLYGGEGNDTIFGDNGNDRLDGQDGDDYLYGGNDDDRAYGGNGQDTIHGEGGNDWLRGVHSHDTLYGGEGSDTLFGDNGNDRLDGEDGDDYLYGGNDNDTLSGGNGNDTFVFNTDAAFDSNDLGVDVIVDFGDGNDLINLDLTTFTALSSRAGTGFSNGRELAVVSQDERVATNDAYILYSSSTGNLFYNENGAEAGLGNGGHFATLENAAQLEANNFTLSD